MTVLIFVVGFLGGACIGLLVAAFLTLAKQSDAQTLESLAKTGPRWESTRIYDQDGKEVQQHARMD